MRKRLLKKMLNKMILFIDNGIIFFLLNRQISIILKFVYSIRIFLKGKALTLITKKQRGEKKCH